MLRDKFIAAVHVIFLGPTAILYGLAIVALVTTVLFFLVPASVCGIGFAIFALAQFAVDFFVHPSLLKVWGVICFFAACVLIYAWLRNQTPLLPNPDVRRGRPIESQHDARRRAVDAIHRRRESLRNQYLP